MMSRCVNLLIPFIGIACHGYYVEDEGEEEDSHLVIEIGNGNGNGQDQQEGLEEDKQHSHQVVVFSPVHLVSNATSSCL